jgi:hypothetical protein
MFTISKAAGWKAVFPGYPEALSTLGAGQGVVAFYGMAKPMRTPLIGPPRKYS